MSSQTRPAGSARDDESRPLLDLPIDAGSLRSGSHGRTLAGAATLTLVATGLERAAFYSLQSNIVYFLLHTFTCIDPSTASWVSVLFLTLTYFLCLFVGLVSDLFVPPYWAIVAGYVPYVLGYAFLTWTGFCATSLVPSIGPNCSIEWCPGLTTYTNISSSYFRPPVSSENTADDCRKLYHAENWKVYLAFAGVVLGASIQRTLVAPFGADQVKNQGLSATRGYFWKYYWSLNVGSLVGNIGMSFLQMGCGYGTGFLVPLGLLLLSCLIFASGYKNYRRRSPNRAAIKYFITIIQSGFRLWRNRPRIGRNFGLYGLGFLDYAKVVNGGAHSIVAVENVKATTRIVFVLAVIFPYFFIYAKTMSAFADEGPHMAATNESKNQNKQVPVSLLVAFNNIGLLVTIPLCNLVVYPLLCRWGVRLTMNKRITLGIFVITMCLLTAGGVEFARERADKTDYQWIGETKYSNVSTLSVFYQIPQYALLGASEAFTFVSVIEFTYILSPGCLQGIMMGILWTYVGLSQLINLLLVALPYGYKTTWAPTAFYFGAAAVAACLTLAFARCGMKCDAGLDTLTVPEPPRPVAQQHPVDPRGSSSPLTSSDSQPNDSLQQ